MLKDPREVIFLLGGVGVGKSRAGLSIADACPDKFVHFIVADRAIDKLYEHYPDIQDRNVIEYDGFSYQKIEKAVADIKLMTNDEPAKHWIVIDTIGQVYKMKQDAIAEKHYGAPMGEFKAEQKSIGGLMNYQWTEVKAGFYNEVVYPVIRYSRCNVLLIGHTVPLQGPYFTRPDTPIAADRFRAIGLVPDVHKDLVRYTDTIIHLGVEENNYWMETIKETGIRQYIPRTPVDHFWNDYMRLSRNGTINQQ
jgi:hypothetical protein